MMFPNDILYEIIKFCTKNDLISINLVSKNIYKISSSDNFWKSIYKQKYGKYIFNNNLNWKKKYINRNKTKIIINDIIKEISKIKIEEIGTDLIYSNINDIKWIDDNLIKKTIDKKFKTLVKNHNYHGYFISRIYIVDDDELHLSNYFVNDSKNYSILYKIQFDKY